MFTVQVHVNVDIMKMVCGIGFYEFVLYQRKIFFNLFYFISKDVHSFYQRFYSDVVYI